MRSRLQGVLFLSGIALVIVGFNGSRALVVAGLALILLVVLGRMSGRRQA